jgi:hypothetical protein
MVYVPKIPELSASQLVIDAARNPKLKDYLPDLVQDEGGVKNINR